MTHAVASGRSSGPSIAQFPLSDSTSSGQPLQLALYELAGIVQVAAFACEARRTLGEYEALRHHVPGIAEHASEWAEYADDAGGVLRRVAARLKSLADPEPGKISAPGTARYEAEQEQVSSSPAPERGNPCKLDKRRLAREASWELCELLSLYVQRVGADAHDLASRGLVIRSEQLARAISDLFDESTRAEDLYQLVHGRFPFDPDGTGAARGRHA